MTIYKVLTADAWHAAHEAGVYEGSEHDQRDGFIHFSTAQQLAETLQKHFAGVSDLVLLYVREPAEALRWEPSRDGALFPHLYGSLPVAAVERVEALTLDARGLHVLPELAD
jgi:uncharacterized protein (DUF952 family)